MNSVDNLGYLTGSNSPTTFTNSEAETLVHSNRVNQFNDNLSVVTRQYHLLAFGQVYGTGDVSGAEIELRAIAAEERRVTSAFVLAQHVYGTGELGVGLDGLGLCQNLAANNVLLVNAAKQQTNVITKPYAGQFTDVCEPKQHLIEFRDYDKELTVGEVLGVDIFKDATFVDVTGTTKGKGYAGGMKRHGFSGGRATHGSKFHRDIGGTAMSSTPARTFKGHRMAGHMGNERMTVQNLKVVRVDEEMQVLMVKGAIPGPAQSVVIVKKAIKK